MTTIPLTSPGQTLAGLAGVGHKSLHDAVAAEVNLAITGRSTVAQGTTDPTISSTTTAAFANPTKTITTQAGSDVYLWANMGVSSTGSDQIFFRARVDSGSWVLIGGVNPTNTGIWVAVGFARFAGLSAASHIFEIGWDNLASGITATSTGLRRNLMVLEVHK